MRLSEGSSCGTEVALWLPGVCICDTSASPAGLPSVIAVISLDTLVALSFSLHHCVQPALVPPWAAGGRGSPPAVADAAGRHRTRARLLHLEGRSGADQVCRWSVCAVQCVVAGSRARAFYLDRRSGADQVRWGLA